MPIKRTVLEIKIFERDDGRYFWTLSVDNGMSDSTFNDFATESDARADAARELERPHVGDSVFFGDGDTTATTCDSDSDNDSDNGDNDCENCKRERCDDCPIFDMCGNCESDWDCDDCEKFKRYQNGESIDRGCESERSLNRVENCERRRM